MECPKSFGARLQGAVSVCPFLRSVAEEQGIFCAARAATACSAPGRGPVLEERVDSLEATFSLFHGHQGVVPLLKYEGGYAEQLAPATPGVCPFSGQRAAFVAPDRDQEARKLVAEPRSRPLVQKSAAPLASFSIPLLGFLPWPGDFWAKRARQRRQRRRERKPPAGELPGASAASTSSTAQGKAARPQPRAVKAKPVAAGGGGSCSLRNLPILGGLIPLSAKGELACPEAIMAARRAAARLKPVRDLRPQALPVKMLAIGLMGAFANVPCGAWRVHTEKFSPGWFLAVHATIPFIAILRKAVVMPRWAILLTIAAAVAGQFAGAKLERRRLACVAERQEVLGAGSGGRCRGSPLKALRLQGPLPLAASFLQQGASLVMAI